MVKINADRRKKKVFVAVSGGVDSSTAAFLLQKQGYDVSGAFMRCYNIDGCAEEDEKDARRTAAHLGIPFYVFDFEEEYKKRVVGYMIEGYRRGETPNPDVMCNKEIKFGLFLEKAISLGAEYIATGHYAKIGKLGVGSWKLEVAQDSAKDQSYFLWTLTQEKLHCCLFPIGDYRKTEVREIARGAGLPTAEKKDSQGICFLGKFSLTDFLKQSIPPEEGPVVNERGEKIGTHDGVWFYTIGQRHIRIRQDKGQEIKDKGDAKPYYVAEKKIDTNTLVVVQGSDNPALYKKEILIRDANFITKPPVGKRVFVRTRYREPLSEARISQLTIHNPQLVFKEPHRAIAPGQSAVFYGKTGELLGGGVIM